MKKVDSKPTITIRRRLLDGEVCYKCEDKKLMAYGSTPKEAYEMWRQISSVREWKAQ